MDRGIFHIFRNSPLGRETLFQSIYFARTLSLPLKVYIPETRHFLIYFDHTLVQVDLDASYVRHPDTAAARLEALINGNGIHSEMVIPDRFTGPGLPDIRPDFDFMCCPRCLSHPSARIGLGMIGPKVRMLVNRATFPVLITSPVYKPWNSLALLSGGGAPAGKARDVALLLNARCGLPVDDYRLENGPGAASDTDDDVRKAFRRQCLLDKKSGWESALYEIPHDALVVVGTDSEHRYRSLLIGSLLENAQGTLTNNLLVVGPNVNGAFQFLAQGARLVIEGTPSD
jgi:hypothetical protein